jgi:hypothetical protein
MIYTIIFYSLLVVTLLLLYYFLKIKRPVSKRCKFKISKIKYYQSVHNRKFANFSVYIKNKNAFFVDFPILFEFYSDQRFNSKVRISYSTLNGEAPEEILNKHIQFETKTKSYTYFINDIIVGKIDIEIELLIDYGNPVIKFEILKNSYCELMDVYKKEIKFTKLLKI